VAGFQAIKLNTCSGRFRLRLLDAETGSPVASCQVYASSAGFEALGDRDRLPPPDRHGWVASPRPFDELAYVRIDQPGGAISRVLLPITEPWCEQVCRLRVDERAAEKRDFDRRVTALVQDVQVLESMLDEDVRRVNELNGDRQYERALKRVRAAVRAAGPFVGTTRDDLAELTDRAAEVGRASYGRLAWAAKQVESAAERVGELRDLDGRLERTIEEAVALDMATTQARLAEDLIKQGDVDGAIANYREAVRLSPQAGFQQRLDDLQRTWQLKDHDHRMARQFVLQTWPEAEITQLESLQPEAERAFEKLVEVDDHLTARRLSKATSRHLRELADLVDMLSQRNTEADRRQCEAYLQLTERMARFQLDVGAYLERRLAGPAKPSDERERQVQEVKGQEIMDEEEPPPLEPR
jgi:tetratricopeptide (TPR) repeat protein